MFCHAICTCEFYRLEADRYFFFILGLLVPGETLFSVYSQELGQSTSTDIFKAFHHGDINPKASPVLKPSIDVQEIRLAQKKAVYRDRRWFSQQDPDSTSSLQASSPRSSPRPSPQSSSPPASCRQASWSGTPAPRECCSCPLRT